MFQLVEKYPKTFQAILALVSLPFIFFGISSYQAVSNNIFVAKIGNSVITPHQLNQSIERQIQNFGENDLETQTRMANDPGFRYLVLKAMIYEQLSQQFVIDNHISIDDSVLAKTISEEPAFQTDGIFSSDLYRQWLKQQRLTSEAFEASIRTQMSSRQITTAMSQEIQSTKVNSAWSPLFFAKRTVRATKINETSLDKQVTVSTDEVKRYYETHQSDYFLPEKVKLNYVVFSPDALKKNITVSEQSINETYQQFENRFNLEKRRVRHILIPDNSENNAFKQANQIREELLKTPEQFEELAQKHSKDPGSADKGGDLGWVSRGVMVPEFEKAMLDLNTGDISPVIKTEFGYHILQVTEIDQEQVLSLEEAKNQIKNELLDSEAKSLFTEGLESFKNMVYEQVDQLDLVAKRFSLPIQESEWIEKTTFNEAPEPFNKANIFDAIFSKNVTKNDENTDALEVNPETFIAARAISFSPQKVLELSAVFDKIKNTLKNNKKQVLLQEKGETLLSGLINNDKTTSLTSIEWTTPVTIDRLNIDSSVLSILKKQAEEKETISGNFFEHDTQLISKIFKEPLTSEKNKAYFSERIGNDYVIFEVQPSKENLASTKMVPNLSQPDRAYLGWLASLHYTIEVNEEKVSSLQSN